MDPRRPFQERERPMPPQSRQDEQAREEYLMVKSLEAILCELKKITGLLQVLVQQGSVSAQSMTLNILDLKGQPLMSAQLKVGQTAQAVAQEWSGPNGTGSPLAPVGPIGFTSSDPTIATVDPVSGLVTAVAPGTATIAGLDSVNGLTASDTVSDQLLTAQSMTVVVTANAPAAAPAPTSAPAAPAPAAVKGPAVQGAS